MELSFMCNALKCFGVAKGTTETTYTQEHTQTCRNTHYITNTRGKNKKRQP